MEQNNFSISVMTLDDLNIIKDSLEIEYDDFWNYNVFKSELQNPNSTYFVLKNNNDIIGFAGIIIILDEADITNIVIKKDFRGNGISKKLLNHIIEYCNDNKCNKIHLEVSSENQVAINLYKSFGFEEVGLRKKYYGNFDAILYTKKLEKQ